MSRSYKKTPVCKCGGRIEGTRKYWKRQANRKIRKSKVLNRKSKYYKKLYESWNIRDYRFYIKRGDTGKMGERMWERYYRRK